MVNTGPFKGRYKYGDKIRLHVWRHHRDEYPVNIDPPTGIKDNHTEPENDVHQHDVQRDCSLDWKYHVMFHVGCGIPWNVANHPCYIHFMKVVGVKAVRRTQMGEKFDLLREELVDEPVQRFVNQGTSLMEVSVCIDNEVRRLKFKPRLGKTSSSDVSTNEANRNF